MKLLKDFMRKKISLAICSNNTDFWYKRQIEKCGYNRFFDNSQIIISCHLGVSKSGLDLEMFKAAANSLGVDCDSCICIDDRYDNIQQALNCGMTGVLFPSETKHGVKYLSTLLKKMGI